MNVSHRFTPAGVGVLFALLLVFCGVYSIAEITSIDSNWIWAGGKRNLKVHINVADPTIKQKIKDALAAWNAAGTGWTFDESGTAADNDVEIKLGDIPKKSGGAVTSADKVNAAGEIEHVTITFDKTPVEGFAWGDGAVGSKTKSILGCLMHELSHVIGLDHEGGRRKTTKEIADPGNADTEDIGATSLSADDINHAKETAKPPPAAPPPAKKDTDLGPASSESTLNVDGHVVTFPAGVFLTDAHIVFGTAGRILLPAKYCPGTMILIKGIDIISTSAPYGELPQVDTEALIDVTIPYIDETSGPLLDLVDPDWGPVDESTLVPMYYDVDQDCWVMLDTEYSINTSENAVTFAFPAYLLTGYHSFTSMSDPDGSTGIIRLAIAGETGVIPTLDEFGLIILGILLCAAIVLFIRKSRGLAVPAVFGFILLLIGKLWRM